MSAKFWKWWTVVNIGIWGLALSQLYFRVLDLLLAADATYLTFLILAIGLIFTALVALNYKNIINNSENKFYWFMSETVLSIGMIGTLLGFLIVLGQAFSNIDPSNVQSMTAAITQLAVGMSTALVTTLVGLIVAIWMKFQLVILEK